MDFTGPYNIVEGTLFFAFCILAGLYLLRAAHRGFVGAAMCQAAQVVSFAVVGRPHVVVQAGPKIALISAWARSA